MAAATPRATMSTVAAWVGVVRAGLWNYDWSRSSSWWELWVGWSDERRAVSCVGIVILVIGVTSSRHCWRSPRNAARALHRQALQHYKDRDEFERLCRVVLERDPTYLPAVATLAASRLYRMPRRPALDLLERLDPDRNFPALHSDARLVQEGNEHVLDALLGDANDLPNNQPSSS